jgi:hypothetical protein
MAAVRGGGSERERAAGRVVVHGADGRRRIVALYDGSRGSHRERNRGGAQRAADAPSASRCLSVRVPVEVGWVSVVVAVDFSLKVDRSVRQLRVSTLLTCDSGAERGEV